MTTLWKTVIVCFAGSLPLIFFCADYDELDDPDRKPDPVTLAISEVTDSSVTLHWSRCVDEEFAKYELYYGTNDIVDRNDKLADSLSFDVDTIKTVQPLDDLTRYYFRVIVYNKQGNYSVSNIVDTVTPEDMKGKLRLIAAGTDEENNVKLLWTKALETVDRYSVHADTAGAVDTSDTLVATVYNDTTETLMGLAAGRTWRLRVYGRLESTIVATSNVIEVSIPED